ncbi:hypothetical protein 1 [Changjiang picorna-like virus 13]|uniref:hypothetical protein 1 n=1 Tax=Changjiang picorna-like virus 13 TaxID=1922786 RepID=UPI000909D43F|nr:hypothetical protein 1 [Changjiang picorna-like virus 13]APG79029.1 hypothetical protein 1 [Changjiang picorna-like virus 13]
MMTTTCTENQTALLNEEIIQCYIETESRAFCPMTKAQKFLSRWNLYVCLCHLCTAERVAKDILEIERKMRREVKFGRNNKLIKVFNLDELTTSAIIALNKDYDYSVPQLMEKYFRSYVQLTRILKEDPFLSFDDIMDRDEFSYMLSSPSILRYFRRLFVRTQPRCYQIYVLQKDRKRLLYHQPPNSPEDLVGVEHNPGPNYNLMQYLKHMDKIEDFATTRKRSSKVAKAIVSIERKHDKKRQQELEKQRRLKNMNFLPEGLFDSTVKIEESSRIFLEDIVDRLISSTMNIDVSHNIEIPFQHKVSAAIVGLQKLGTKVWNLAVAFIKLILSFFHPIISDFILPFLEEEKEIWMDAPEFAPEMSVQWDTLVDNIYTKHLIETVEKHDWSSFCRIVDMLKSLYFRGSSFTFYQKLAEETAEFLFDIFGIKVPFLYKEDLLMKELFSEAKLLYSQFSNGQIDDYAFADRVMVFVNEIENHLYEKRQTVSPVQKEKLTHLLRKFHPVMQYCMRYVNPNNGPRVEPLAILIAGPTGVGKSTITVPFLLALMSRILPKDKKEQFMNNHNDFLFFRANENEFWDGYKMRNVAIIYDDFGQMKDAVGAPSADAFEMIRLKNTAPYHLHFASIEDKQRNFATPKLIFATTNLSKLWFNGLTCSEAVSRRFDMAYVQVPKIEYSKTALDNEVWSRRLDIDKVRKDFPLKLNDPASFVPLDVVEFIPWDFARGCQASGEVLGFWQLLDACETKFNEVSCSGDRMLQFHKFLKENPRVMPENGSAFSFSTFKNLAQSCLNSVAKVGTFYQSRTELPSKAKFILGAFVGILSVGLMLRGNNEQNETLKLESSNSKSEVKDKKVKQNIKSRSRVIKRTNRAVKPANGMISAQSGDTQLNSYLKVLKRNMYKLGSKNSEKDYGWVVFLFDRTFLMPRHFLLALDSEAYSASLENNIVTVSFKNPYTGNCAMVVDWQNDVSLYDYAEANEQGSCVDYVFMTIKESKCRIHSDITEMFADDSKFRDGEKVKAQMVVQRQNEILFLLPDVCITKSKLEYGSQVYDEDKEICVYTNTITYSAPTEFGDCGSVLLSIDPRFTRPTIIGIHTAGNRNQRGHQKTALGTYIERSHIEKLRKQLPSLLKQEVFVVDDVTIEGFAGIRAAVQPRVPNETKIFKSVLASDLWGQTTKPANLKPFLGLDGFKDPAKIARMGYSHSEVFIDSEVLDTSHVLVSELVLKKVHSQPWEPRIFSFEEAVLGVPGVDFVESVNRSTSPGYPYVLENRQKGKTAWFGNGQEINIGTKAAKEFKSKVLEIISKAREGIRCEHVFVDYLKDERRPIEKVDQGKTRQFMACGMDYLVCVKMYFGDFIRSICQNKIQNGIAVGINPFSEWDTLVAYLNDTPSKKFTAGDYSKFDARIPVSIAYAVLDIVEQFYYNSTDEDRKIRQILWLEIVNSMHISQGVIYEFCGGNPSGQPMTSIFNSIANLEMLAYVGLNNYIRYSSEFDFADVFRRTKFSVFGDDNVIAYEPSDKDIFGQRNLEKHAFEDLGMTYTNESKNDDLVEDRNITEVSFLKRGFRKDHGIWMCPLQEDVLKETLSWERQGSTETEMKLRAEAVLAEFARHGQSVFEECAPVITRAMQKHYDYVCKNSKYHLAIEDGNGLQYV